MSTHTSNSKSKNLNKEIIALFSGQASTVTTPKLYIQLTGSMSSAVVLNQAVFWSNKSSCKDGFFHKKYDEWFDEINIPARTLRRRFDKLESHGWITTKVKMVLGKNIKHVRPNMEKIIESISLMLDIDRPNRPQCPDGEKHEQKPCTKVAPIGQCGRSESANVADSYNEADHDLQIKKTNTAVSSFLFSETIDNNILSQKLSQDERSDEEFMDNVVDHVDNHSDKKHSRIVRAQGVLKLLTQLKTNNQIFYAKGRQPTDKTESSVAESENAVRRMFESDRQALINSIFAEKTGEYSKASYACKAEWETLRANYRKEFEFLKYKHSKQSA